MATSQENNLGGSLLYAYYMPRSRIEKILDYATGNKLVYLIAGAGYGKTQAVRSYVKQQQDAVVRWVQLTESDNVGARYWEHLTHNIAYDNPELADRLREFGFPETGTRFKQFAEIIKNMEHRSHKTFLVLDDFHLIHSEQALAFAERCAHLKIPGACVIIISRTQPEINTVALFAKGQASIITEDELRFTNDEIAEFFSQRGIDISAANIPELAEATKGWALAIQLLAPILQKTPKNIGVALDTMKQNVFKLMETEAWNDFPDDIKKTMAKMSLVSELPINMLWSRFNDSAFLQEAPQLMPFVWFDSFTGQDRVHPLYWEFLTGKQHMLTDGEKLDTYRQAAEWCLDNSFYLDTVKYLAASHQYERMLSVLLSYPHKPPKDTCEYFLGILQSLAPGADEPGDTNYLLLTSIFIPLLLSGVERFDEATGKCLEAIAQWENSNDTIAPLLVSIAYSNLAYIDMYACTVSHKYGAPGYLKKSVEYAEKYSRQASNEPVAATGAFSVADIRSFACLVGEGATLAEFDEFLDMARETARYITQSSQDMYYGYDDLVACEIAFYKNKPEEAKRYAHEAILKAREKGQYSIEAMAAMYLYRIAILEGDYPLVKELFREKTDNPGSPNFWNRKFLYELGIGFLYVQIGLPKRVPSWLITDEKDDVLEIPVPVRELICATKYYIAARQYDRALTLLGSNYPRKPYDRYLLGELTLLLLTAVAKIRTGDVNGAVRDFTRAYSLSFDGVIEMPFVELGKDLHPLTGALSEQAQSGIPDKWIKKIERKASVYTKKSAVVLESFKREQNIEDAVILSQREIDVLKDLYHGLSRGEIATTRYLSINTVHKVVQSIFMKLDAYGKADAIRIAVDKGILE